MRPDHREDQAHRKDREKKLAKRGPIIRKVDACQHAIVKAWRAANVSVALTHVIGKGCPDCFIGFERNGEKICLPVEIKMPGEKLTTDELDWWSKWKGPGATVRSVEEALALIK